MVFLENAVDVFASGAQLVGIRAKNDRQKPIAILPDLAKETIKIVNLTLSPLLLLGFGAVVFWKRKK